MYVGIHQLKTSEPPVSNQSAAFEVPADAHGHLGSRHAGPVGCHRATVAVAPAGLRGRLRGGSGLETWEGLRVERWAGEVGRNRIGFVLFCRNNKARPAWNWKMWFDLLVEGLRFTHFTQHTRLSISALAVIQLCWARTLCSGTMSQPLQLQPRNPVKALFVPITETQMAELQALSERGCLEDEKSCWILLVSFFATHWTPKIPFKIMKESACTISQLSL